MDASTGSTVKDYTWQQGRQLSSFTKDDSEWTYTYDANGMRTSRSGNGKTYNYVYNGDQLTQMTIVTAGVTETVDITYDANGSPFTLTYDGPVDEKDGTYYYITNIQGDVIGITDNAGNLILSYHYDAYGKTAYTYTNTNNKDLAATLTGINPLTYRSYVMDTGTGLYYLQSRYYNPEIGRFINADAFASTGQGLLGNNMFAYCLNNPVNLSDPTGTSSSSGHNAVQPWLCDCASCNTSTAVTYYYYFKEENDADGFWETINNHFVRQQETEIQIIMLQNKLIQQGASAMWDAYVVGYNNYVSSQHQESVMLVQGFNYLLSVPEEAIDMIGASIGMSSAVYSLALLILSGGPITAIAVASAGVVWAGWGVYRGIKGLLQTFEE